MPCDRCGAGNVPDARRLALSGVRLQDRLLRLVTAADTTRIAEEWTAAVAARHTRDMSRPEFLKAARALSARYVERRSTLRDRSPLDSNGKRAAFAGLYAPLHALTTRAIVQALSPATDDVAHLVDLGCGTGAASAGWMHGIACAAIRLRRRSRRVGASRGGVELARARDGWAHAPAGFRAGRARPGGRRHARASARERRPSCWAGRPTNSTARPSPVSSRRSSSSSATAPRCSSSNRWRRASSPWWDDWRRTLAPFQPRADIWRFTDAIHARDRGPARGGRFSGRDARRPLALDRPARSDIPASDTDK